MELVNFIKSNNNWEEILSKDPYNIKISRDNGYILFKYNQLSSDFNISLVRECRGIILRESDYKIVCHPFDKFGNYGESYCPDINWKKASVQQKVDGSLMKVWFDDGWHISTNGTINAFNAELQNNIKYKTYGDLFISALPVAFGSFVDSLDEDMTYMFELVSPYNRVVIPYDNTELYYLGARNNITQEECLPENTELSWCNWFKMPLRYNMHTLEDVQEVASTLPWDEEGYVVCDDKFNRVKIKSPEYVKAHYARSNNTITKEKLLDIIRSGETDEFLIYASDYEKEIERIKYGFERVVAKIFCEIAKIHPEKYDNRKEYALEVLKKEKWLQPFLFRWEDATALINKTESKKFIEYMAQEGFIYE